jgi:UDP-N-acetylmuramoylalanine--D-glutamate ligase
MNWNDLRGTRATVMGLGLFGGGLAAARYLAGRGVRVLVTDLRDATVLKDSIDALAGVPVEYRLGEHRDEDFTNTDFVVANPAVPPQSRYLARARGAGVAITSELDLFLRACPSQRVVAITGTNGKTSTTTLAGEMLKLSLPRVFVGGNIGKSLLECLDGLQPDDAIVLEVSSFQLEVLDPPRPWPRVAAVTNLSPDHLDRHGSMERYISAKRRIVEFQDASCTAVLNAGDPAVSAFRDPTPARVVTFSRSDPEATYAVASRGARRLLVERLGGVETVLADAASLAVPGEFQTDNALCAAAAARAAGATVDAVGRAIAAFRGVAHRLQPLDPVRGVRFFDNAVSTVPESTISALEAVPGPIRWIAGGKSKGLDLAELGAAARRLVRKTYVYGEAAPELRATLESAGARCAQFTTLSQAFEGAWAEALPGDAIVYSPAFPSFDQYRNYKDRGREFLQLAAAKRQAIRGTPCGG